MLKRPFHKLHNSHGASVGEMLVCVLILLLASSAVTSVIALGSSEFEKSFSSSQAQSVCSTLMSAVENELRYTGNVTVTKDSGYINALSSEDGCGGGAVDDFAYIRSQTSFLASFDSDEDGRKVITPVSASTKEGEDPEAYDLVAPGTYSHNLKATVTVNSISTKKVNADEIEAVSFNVTIELTKGSSDKVVESANFDVIPLGHPKVTEKEKPAEN